MTKTKLTLGSLIFGLAYIGLGSCQLDIILQAEADSHPQHGYWQSIKRHGIKTGSHSPVLTPNLPNPPLKTLPMAEAWRSRPGMSVFENIRDCNLFPKFITELQFQPYSSVSSSSSAESTPSHLSQSSSID